MNIKEGETKFFSPDAAEGRGGACGVRPERPDPFRERVPRDLACEAALSRRLRDGPLAHPVTGTGCASPSSSGPGAGFHAWLALWAWTTGIYFRELYYLKGPFAGVNP